jgi:hypothetical protein
MLSEEVFLTGMKRLSDAWPDFPLGKGTTELYRERLDRLSDREFAFAVNHHLDTGKWFPRISELLDAIRDHGPTVHDTWNLLLAAAETGQKPKLDAATKKALAVLGGWEVFQYTSYDDLQFRFKDFKAALLEARARDTLTLAGGEQKALPE